MDANSTAEQLLLLNAYQKLNADLHMNGTVAANGVNANGGVNNNNGSISSGVVEDFCELCNKQFCNKYYLKVVFYFISSFELSHFYRII